MDAIEKAIRTALAKGDAGNAAHREKVYVSALSALERSLRSQPDLDVGIAENRRLALRKKIQQIELEYRPSATTPLRDTPAASDVSHDKAGPESETGFKTEETPSADFVSELRPTRSGATDESEGERIVQTGEKRTFSRHKAPFAKFLVVCLLLGFIGIGLWWIYSSGVLLPLSQRDGSVPNPPPSLQQEEFSPARTGSDVTSDDTSQAGTWIEVFSPDDPTTVTTPSGTRVEVRGEGRDRAMRIIPASTDSAALFDLGEGLLNQIAGKQAIFGIAASVDDGEATQMSIQCNFAELGDCGRKRFDVETTRREFLFRVDLPDRAPGSFGSIALTPDISGGNTAVNIFRIRVFVPEE